MSTIPYCGTPPLPGELLNRFNLDPVLIVALALLAGWHLLTLRRSGRPMGVPATGWAVAAFAFLSPLCALSVSLFAARIGQHMILVLIAAPLIAAGSIRKTSTTGKKLIANSIAFALPLWFWHLPAPYMATFQSDWIYWTMHITLFGSAILLWRDLIHHRAADGLPVMAAGLITSVQMGLLGAILTFVATPLFPIHYLTSPPWGFTPLADQQLGGLLMWVPGILLFLLAAWRSLTIVLTPELQAK